MRAPASGHDPSGVLRAVLNVTAVFPFCCRGVRTPSRDAQLLVIAGRRSWSPWNARAIARAIAKYFAALRHFAWSASWWPFRWPPPRAGHRLEWLPLKALRALRILMRTSYGDLRLRPGAALCGSASRGARAGSGSPAAYHIASSCLFARRGAYSSP